MMDTIQALGATPVPMAFGDVYSGLQTGEIDGAENNWPSYESTRHYEVAKYFTLDEHTRVPELQLAAQSTWDKLPEEYGNIIRDCAREGYALGFRTFVMQGGEDGAFSVDVVCHLVRQIKAEFPDCAVTLSLGEFPREAYQAMFDAGADRYLLRHETANKAHYEKLHPAQMSFDNRMRCLRDLKDIGYQTGCGFMVGSPYQTARTLAEDLKFIEEFRPEMCGIGPFIPQKDTPFRDFPAGTCEQTVYLLSLLRLIQPHLLLPATTALGTIRPDGRERGLQAGANVVMPNLSPLGVRKKYALYDGKLCTGEEAAQCIGCLSRRVASVGCRIVTARGDIIR